MSARWAKQTQSLVTETVGGDGSTAINVSLVENVRCHLVMHLVLVLVELGELVRVDRRVPVRGVREVLELQHLCSGRGAPQTHIAICAEARKRSGRLGSLPDRTWSCAGLQRIALRDLPKSVRGNPRACVV